MRLPVPLNSISSSRGGITTSLLPAARAARRRVSQFIYEEELHSTFTRLGSHAEDCILPFHLAESSSSVLHSYVLSRHSLPHPSRSLHSICQQVRSRQALYRDTLVLRNIIKLLFYLFLIRSLNSGQKTLSQVGIS